MLKDLSAVILLLLCKTFVLAVDVMTVEEYSKDI